LCVVLAAVLLYLLLTKAATTVTPADGGGVPSGSTSGADDRQAGRGEIVLESKGWILATHQYKVGPNQVGGKVEWLHERFLEGERFSEGTPLARLEDTEYRRKYEQALEDFQQAKHEVKAAEERLVVAQKNRHEEIQQAKAELEEGQATLEKLRLDLERNNGLKSGGALARRDYEESKFGYEAQKHRVRMLTLKHRIMKDGPRKEIQRESEANLRKAKANLQRAKAAREEARWRLNNCTIKAPVSGTILKKTVEIGDPIDARAFNLASIFCEMADMRELEVELMVQERDIARVRIGQRCRIVPEAHPERTFTGKVFRMMPTADRAKGAIPVRVKVNKEEIPPWEAGKYLYPDGAAIVTIWSEKKDAPRKQPKLN
jgi:multidrug resistance efflux pump